MAQTLGEDLDHAISGPGEVAVERGDVRVRADVRGRDRYGVELDRLRIEGPAQDVKRRTEALAERLRPCGERLRVVEVDPGLGGGVLRSEADDMRGGRYFEVQVEPTATELRRVRRDEDGGRTSEPFTLTHEELERVVDDLSR